MRTGSRILSSDGPQTRLGRLVLAGEVVDDEPVMPSSLRVMDDYVLSVVSDEFHLSRRFRAHFGVPPSVYRQSSTG